MKQVFIDGSAGTTGIQIFERLAERDDIKLNILTGADRKDPDARKNALNKADIAFFCLPDAAAVEAAGWCENPDTVIIDTSTAHRCDDGWTYGFPELCVDKSAPGYNLYSAEYLRDRIRESKRIANPGCHASGFIALAAPLVQAGLIPKDALLTCFSLTGYSGGGRKMIEEYEGAAGEGKMTEPYASPRQYGLSQSHKHLPEMAKLTGLKNVPAFCPIVASFRQGMEVTIPVFADQLSFDSDLLAALQAGGAGSVIRAIRDYYTDYYQGPVVRVNDDADESGFLAAGKMAGRDDMEIAVFGNNDRILLTARFDNLGKGACGAAIQNMNLVLGLDETTGLVIGRD
ncbi:MAG: N-acetyl-gamma-glutamyl-phosphate reductase [Lachnospiraceae bacterium]|nr:N-acetyl-gamma-glutamyl-phosphate reductase [Lachnospiraceae bacterium]